MDSRSELGSTIVRATSSSLDSSRDVPGGVVSRCTIARHQFALRVLDNAPVVIVVLSLDGNIEYVNPYFETLTGFSAAEVAGLSWVDTLIPTRHRDEIRALFDRSVAGRHRQGHVNPIITRSGAERTIEWNNDYLRADDGSATGVLAIGQDVTERLSATEARLQSEQRANALSHFAGLGAWDFDLRTQRVWWSEEQYRISGLPVGTPPSSELIWALVHPEDRPQLQAALLSALTNGAWEGEYRTIRDGCDVRVIHGRIRVLRDANQMPVLLSGTTEDITDRRRVESARRATEQRMATVLDQLEDGVFALDSQWRYTFINGAGAAMLGATPDGLLGRSFHECWPMMRGSAWDRMYQQVMSERTPATVYAYDEPTGRWWEASAAPTGDGISVVFRDVSARIRSEKALEKERSRLREAQRLAMVGSWELDVVTGDLAWSDEIFRIFELDATTFTPSYEAFLSAVHPDDRDLVNRTYRGSLESRTDYEVVHRLQMPDGRIKYVQERGTSSYDDANRPFRSVGTVQDISVQIQSERRLRSILDGIFVFVGLFDLDGRLIEANRAPLELAGLERDQVLGRPFWDTYWWSHSPSMQDRLRSALARAAQGEVVRAELIARFGANTLLTLDAMFSPVIGVHGTVEAIIGSAVDITARLAAEKRDRDREARLEAVFNHASDSMTLLDVEPSGTLRVVAANRASIERARNVKRVDESDLVGLTFEELALHLNQNTPEGLNRFQTRLQQVIDLRLPAVFEHHAVFPSGPFVGEVRVVPVLDAAGDVRQLLWISKDITARKKSDEALRSSLREKETLLREIHHRVKNNLQVIAGLLHFQAKTARTAEDVESFAKLRQRIFAMTLLHEQLYRSDDLTSVSLGDYLTDLVTEFMRSLTPRDGVRVEVTAESVRLPIEFAMPTGMIVSELVTNAMKYAFPDARTGCVRVAAAAADDTIVVTVDDDGVGFPEHFDMERATSFGWELVRTLVMQLDGEVAVRNDRGAHVRVTFPFVSASELAAAFGVVR